MYIQPQIHRYIHKYPQYRFSAVPSFAIYSTNITVVLVLFYIKWQNIETYRTHVAY